MISFPYFVIKFHIDGNRSISTELKLFLVKQFKYILLKITGLHIRAIRIMLQTPNSYNKTQTCVFLLQKYEYGILF